MAKITVGSLKKGVKHFELEVESNKKADLEKALDEYLETTELGYECPSCGKDIPDVDFCPYCNEVFDDEEELEEEVEELEDEVEGEMEEEAEEEAEDEMEEIAEEEVDGEDVPEEIIEDIAEEIVKQEKQQKEKEKKDQKKKEKLEEVKEYKEEAIREFVEKVNGILGEGFDSKERKTGLTYFKEKKRVMKIVTTTRTPIIEFNVQLDDEHEDLTIFTESEAKKKHLGTVRGMFVVKDEEKALELIEKATSKI